MRTILDDGHDIGNFNFSKRCEYVNIRKVFTDQLIGKWKHSMFQ